MVDLQEFFAKIFGQEIRVRTPLGLLLIIGMLLFFGVMTILLLLAFKNISLWIQIIVSFISIALFISAFYITHVYMIHYKDDILIEKRTRFYERAMEELGDPTKRLTIDIVEKLDSLMDQNLKQLSQGQFGK